MENKAFIEQSERTEKKFPEGTKLTAVQTVSIFQVLNEIMAIGGSLDSMKKNIIYGVTLQELARKGGVELADEDVAEAEARAQTVLDGVKQSDMEDAERAERLQNLDSRSIELMHHSIGMITEAIELLDAVMESIIEGKPLDTANVLEEMGDSNWYQAGLHRLLDSSFEGVNAAVIEKLRVRYPEKFTKEAADDRDLAAEREVLEKHA